MAESKKASQKEEGGYIVATRFMDAPQYAATNKQTYEVGQDVSHLDPERLEALVKAKLVKKA